MWGLCHETTSGGGEANKQGITRWKLFYITSVITSTGMETNGAETTNEKIAAKLKAREAFLWRHKNGSRTDEWPPKEDIFAVA